MTETFMWLGIAYAIFTAFVALLDAKEAHKECDRLRAKMMKKRVPK